MDPSWFIPLVLVIAVIHIFYKHFLWRRKQEKKDGAELIEATVPGRRR